MVSNHRGRWPRHWLAAHAANTSHYTKPTGVRTVLVESAQSMANRLEATCWDAAKDKPVDPLNGISHVTVNRKNVFLTDSMLEAHRLNSPYIERSRGDFFVTTLPAAIGVDKSQPIDRSKFLNALLKYDIGCLIHGVFLESLDGRLRIARALSAFIEASNVEIAASGGVKNDQVQATKEVGKTSSEGFGNVPFARDEYVAEQIDCHINLDLAQIRGYGLDPKAQKLLILLALYCLRKLLDIFFRFFKHILGCRHLLSHSQRGIEIRTYCAIIACMLIGLWTGRKPTLRTYEMICWYFTGMASEDELFAHLAKLKAQDEARAKKWPANSPPTRRLKPRAASRCATPAHDRANGRRACPIPIIQAQASRGAKLAQTRKIRPHKYCAEQYCVSWFFNAVLDVAVRRKRNVRPARIGFVDDG